MNRVTDKDLQNIVARINTMTGSPAEAWGKLRAAATGSGWNVGNYHIASGYGGWKLERVTKSDGCTQDVLGMGYSPRRELRDAMFAFISGWYAAKEAHPVNKANAPVVREALEYTKRTRPGKYTTAMDTAALQALADDLLVWELKQP